MSETKRILLLVLIMAVVCLAVVGSTIAMLYRAAFHEQQEVLVATAQSQARLIEAIAGFNNEFRKDQPEGPEKATLAQIIEAHRHYKGIGETGELTLAKREGDNIVFLLSHRYYDFGTPKPVRMKSKLAEPMRRALSGLSGIVVGLDYRGVEVLAAHEPIAGLNWGIVAKVDLAELRSPFLKASAVALAIAIVMIVIGASLFFYITHPIVRRLRQHSQELMTLVQSLQRSEKSLQQARDDLEMRVKERTNELASANARLQMEVRERVRAETRLKAMWEIAEMVDSEYTELCDRILEGALEMTHSPYAFYGFLDSDERVMSIYSWSRKAAEECRILERPIDFPIAEAGVWANAIRERKVCVINDYSADHPNKIGIPQGHVPITRILAVPVFNQDRIVAVAAAANKATDYDDEDVKQLTAFTSGVQAIIDQRKMEAELRKSEQQCRLLSRKVMEAEEKEKKRLAREMHDGIGQSLAAIKYRTEHCFLRAKEEEHPEADELKTVIQMIQSTMEEMRRIHNDLEPAYIDELGILKTLTHFCEDFQATYSDLYFEKRIDLTEHEVPDYLKTPIYRIFQEAMHNAVQHAEASRINVCLQKTESRIALTVEDDGVGFKEGKATTIEPGGKGLGLYSMRERAELSGGSLEIRSAPGGGTCIRATWPCESMIHAEKV